MSSTRGIFREDVVSLDDLLFDAALLAALSARHRPRALTETLAHAVAHLVALAMTASGARVP